MAMLAVVIEQFGDPSGMAVVERPVPAPSAGQVLIRVGAIGVGGVDAVIRRGTLGSSYRSGMIPGSEVAGTVAAVGDGVDSSWVGRRVWAFTGTEGAYAEYAPALVSELVAIPERLTSAAA